AAASAAPAATASPAESNAEPVIGGETGSRGGRAVRPTIVHRENLDIFMAATAVELLVLNAQVGEMHMVVEVRQVVLERPLFDLARVAVWMAVVVVVVSIALVQPLLVLALHLVVEDDPVDLDVADFQTLGDAQIGLVDLHVVFELALAFEASVELLTGIAVAVTMMIEQVPSAIGQHHGDVAATVNAHGVDETLLAEMAEIATARIGRLPR